MPKLKKKPPKYSKLKQYAVVYLQGKIHYLGEYGSPESRAAYARLVAELQATPVFLPPTGEKDVTVKELAAGFLEHAKATLHPTNYGNYRKVVLDFLLKFYGDDTLVDNFTPRDLKLIRNELINARTKKGNPRYCRGTINANIARIVHIFNWGVGETLVAPGTVVALKAVSSLDEGHPGTFDHEERMDVPDSVIKANRFGGPSPERHSNNKGNTKPKTPLATHKIACTYFQRSLQGGLVIIGGVR